jgi:hypothetical protein
MGLPLDLFLEDRLAQLQRRGRDGQEPDALEDRIESLSRRLRAGRVQGMPYFQ